MHLVWSNSMPYLLLLFIKRYETDRSLDFWWKHILTGRGRYDLGELLIGTMRLQCRQLQCYQCLILLPVLYYFYLVLVGTLLFALATASQQAAVVGRWLKPIERQHKRRCHTSSSSHFIYHNLLQHPLQYNDLTSIIITMLSHIFQSTKSRRFCAQFQNTHKTGL